MMYDEKYVRNYIEINLNEGKSLSEIKQELMEKEVPADVIRGALREAYEDERKYLQRVQQDQGKGKRIHIERLWWLFVLLILAIITASVIAIKRYFIGPF